MSGISEHPTTGVNVDGIANINPATTSQALVLRNSRPQGLRKYLYSCLVGSVAIFTTLYQTGTGLSLFGLRFDATDHAGRTKHVLSTTPLVDGHNDLPYILRQELKNRIYDPRFDFRGHLLSHTDLSKIRTGQLGGQFWSVYMECAAEGVPQLEEPTWVVRDTLEQIDVIKRLIEQQSNDLQFCTTPTCVRDAFSAGKVASMIGIEGSHQIGNSIATLRQMFELGARYMTITHNCDTPFATAATTVAQGNGDLGLTPLGQKLIEEMNRLGMLVDLSHVSPETMRDVLRVTRAPVMFSHSGAFGMTRHLRNAPDDVLMSLKSNGGVIMVPFVSYFLNKDHPEDASIHDVADQILYIAGLIGWDHVGIGSDFDGTVDLPRGLEDASKYPELIQLLMKRGATDRQIRLLAGDNILRVWSHVEKYAQKARSRMQQLPVEDVWEGRKWFHGNDQHLPPMFRDSKKERRDSF